MALIGRPLLVVLDNPLAGVDPMHKRKLIKTIQEWTEGRSLLMATRDVDEAENICDKLAIMKDGKFVAVGSVGDIIKTHGNGYTLEIVTNKKHFNQLTPELKWNEPTILESS